QASETSAKNVTHSSAGTCVRCPTWSAADPGACRPNRDCWSSNTARTPPSSRNQANTYANADCTSGDAYTETPRMIAIVTTTEITPYTFRIMISMVATRSSSSHSSNVM